MTQPTLQPYPSVVYETKAVDGSTCWVAAHPDLPGCEVHAASEEEAMELLEYARAGYLAVLDKMGMEHPLPGSGQQAGAIQMTWVPFDATRNFAGETADLQPA